MNEVRNAIIIGGGPAGLSAAVYNSRAGLAPLLFAGSPPGGQLMLTTEVENFPGFTEIMGPALIENLRAQATHFGTEIRDENIVSLDFNKRPFTVQTSKSEYQSKAVIIATGAKALWLGLPAEERLRGRGVSACATCDGFFFRNKNVAIVGGGDTALEEAQTLTRFAKKVYLIHRRGEFKASKIMQERVKAHPQIELLMNTVVMDILGEQKVEAIQIQTQHEKPRRLDVEGVFIAIGHKPDTELFHDLVTLDKAGYVVTGGVAALEKARDPQFDIQKFDLRFQSMTSVEGVFAGGDCVDTVYRQASTAAGMGVAASIDLERWLEQNH